MGSSLNLGLLCRVLYFRRVPYYLGRTKNPNVENYPQVTILEVNLPNCSGIYGPSWNSGADDGT